MRNDYIMTLALLQNIIGQLAIASKSFNYVFNGNIQEINPQSVKEYPVLVITANGPFREEENTMQYHLAFYYVDRLLKDDSNMQSIYSVATEALRAFIIALRSLDFVVDIPFSTFHPFRATDTQILADRCSGVFTEIDITVLKNFKCSQYDIPTVTISGETHSVLEDYAKRVWTEQNFLKKGSVKWNQISEGTKIAEIEIDGVKKDVLAPVQIYKDMRKLNHYFYYANYPNLDYAYAENYFKDLPEFAAGACTAVKKGNVIGRNYDFHYSNIVEFAVETERTLGVASGNRTFVRNFVESNKVSELYKLIPFYLTDGFNRNGLYANINVVNQEESKGITTYSIPAVEKREEICSIMLVRYILDNFNSASEAVEYIRKYVSIFNPAALAEMGFEAHWMIADKTDCYVLEIVNNAVVYHRQNIMSNFYNDGVTYNEDGSLYSIIDNPEHNPVEENGLTPYASGVERYNIANAYSGDMRTLMNRLLYTNTYTDEEGQDFWYSEYVGGELGIDNTVEEYDENGRIGRIKAQFEERDRENPVTWHTMHSCVYDLDNLTLQVVSQENTSEEFEFAFSDNGVTPEFVEGEISRAMAAETARTESTYAKKSDIPSLRGYATESFVDARLNAETARTESTYAKKGEAQGAVVFTHNDLSDETLRAKILANPELYVFYDTNTNVYFTNFHWENESLYYTFFGYTYANAETVLQLGRLWIEIPYYGGVEYRECRINPSGNFKTINGEDIRGTGNINLGRSLVFKVSDNGVISIPFFTRLDVESSTPVFINYTQYGTYTFVTSAPASIFFDDRNDDYTFVSVRARMQKGDGMYDCRVEGIYGEDNWSVYWFPVQ